MLGLEFQGERSGVGASAHMHVTFFSGFSRVGMKAIEPYCCSTLVHLIGEILFKLVPISL